MSKKSDLSPNELSYIKQREAEVNSVLEAIKKASQFKLGDYLVAYYRPSPWDIPSHGKKHVVNSYGAPKKFTVVHVDRNGICYIKEVNKSGKAVGGLIDQVHFSDGYGSARSGGYMFEVDPDYTDAIIMADEEHFDPTVVHNIKSNLFKEITNHNKSLKVNCNDDKELINFLKTLKVGDVLYKSTKTYFTILSIDPIPTSHNGSRLVTGKVFGTAQTSKGKTFNLDYNTFKSSAIYTGRPRSYNELKDPK
jgi:hypothetical protein